MRDSGSVLVDPGLTDVLDHADARDRVKRPVGDLSVVLVADMRARKKAQQMPEPSTPVSTFYTWRDMLRHIAEGLSRTTWRSA